MSAHQSSIGSFELLDGNATILGQGSITTGSLMDAAGTVRMARATRFTILLRESKTSASCR